MLWSLTGLRKFTDPKTLAFRVWGLKTSLGQFGSKAFGRGLTKPLVKNPVSNFHKQAGPHFFKNHGMNPANKIIQSQKMSSPWGLGTRN